MLWERDGSGWASSFAGEYEPVTPAVWYGGSAWDNQALFALRRHPARVAQRLRLRPHRCDRAARGDGCRDGLRHRHRGRSRSGCPPPSPSRTTTDPSWTRPSRGPMPPRGSTGRASTAMRGVTASGHATSADHRRDAAELPPQPRLRGRRRQHVDADRQRSCDPRRPTNPRTPARVRRTSTRARAVLLHALADRSPGSLPAPTAPRRRCRATARTPTSNVRITLSTAPGGAARRRRSR